MTLVSFSGRRLAFRTLLQRERVTSPASVWDAVSARLAEAAGFELGLLAGSVASHVVLGAPDIVALTLTELAEQARRITRASRLPLMVDADHGYGNALNVRRTVEELETAGVAALTIEDTVLPRRYGGGEGELISIEEYAAKLRAAVSARIDPSLVLIGRTGALARAGPEETHARVRAAAEAGVDAIFVLATTHKEQVEALHAATALPLVVNTAPAPLDELAALGVRVLLQGHLPYFVAMKALHDAYLRLRDEGAPALRDAAAPLEVQAMALAEADYARWAREYLG